MQQEILAKDPSSNLRVYAVWFNMLPHDSRGGRPTGILTDPRVEEFWDENHVVGTAFAPLADWHYGVLWDAYFLYGPGVGWPGGPSGVGRPVAGPPETPYWGRTIFSTREKLKEDFAKTLASNK